MLAAAVTLPLVAVAALCLALWLHLPRQLLQLLQLLRKRCHRSLDTSNDLELGPGCAAPLPGSSERLSQDSIPILRRNSNEYPIFRLRDLSSDSLEIVRQDGDSVTNSHWSTSKSQHDRGEISSPLPVHIPLLKSQPDPGGSSLPLRANTPSSNSPEMPSQAALGYTNGPATVMRPRSSEARQSMESSSEARRSMDSFLNWKPFLLMIGSRTARRGEGNSLENVI